MNNNKKLLALAYINLNRDASPKNQAPQELACAESVSEIIKYLFPDFKGSVSTTQLNNALNSSKHFKRVLDLEPGVIIMSPTGTGTNKNMPNGHVGILLDNNLIASNNSNTGKWDTHFTIASWVARYRTLGGYKIFAYKAI